MEGLLLDYGSSSEGDSERDGGERDVGKQEAAGKRERCTKVKKEKKRKKKRKKRMSEETNKDLAAGQKKRKRVVVELAGLVHAGAGTTTDAEPAGEKTEAAEWEVGGDSLLDKGGLAKFVPDFVERVTAEMDKLPPLKPTGGRGALPRTWTSCVSSDGTVFYKHKMTGQTTFNRPDSLNGFLPPGRGAEGRY